MPCELTVLSNFEGARLGSSRVIGNNIKIELLYDEPAVVDWNRHDYRLHFTFAIENKSNNDQKSRIQVTDGDREVLPYKSPLLYVSESAASGYHRVEVDGSCNEFNKYDFDYLIPAGKTLYFANCLPRTLSYLLPMFDDLASAAGAEREVFGYSIEGRELVAYKLLEEGVDRPLVLISSGIHPPEPDTLATEALIEFFNTDESRRLRERFDFVVVPVMNPDGYAHGSQAGNAAGINFYWDFRYRDTVHCPEAAALYAYAMQLKPALYFDFHAYTFQLRKNASPYCKPVRRYRSNKIQQVVADSYNQVKEKISNGKAMVSFSTFAPSTFSEILTRKLNTICYAKYHIHLKDGVQECKDHAVAAVSTVCDTLLKHKLEKSSDYLIAPYGSIPDEPVKEIFRKLDIYWSGLFFPVMYNIYLKHFKQLIKRK